MASLFLVLAASIGADSKAPGLHEFHQQISDLFKREVQAKDLATRGAIIREMCNLHREIVSDERFTTSDTLKEYRGRLWSRLTKIKTELKQQLARDAKGNKQALEDAALLEAAEPQSIVAADSLAASLSLMDQTHGGPGYLMGFGGRALIDANGRELVDLIERTINPDFWDVVGGPGTIVYYAPLQCLVVRATSEVHGRVGGLVGDLRKAGE
jgi:hypothetical protein